MKRFLLHLAILVGLAAPSAHGLPTPGVLLDSYTAIVNGKVITLGDVLAALQPAQERLAMQFRGRELEQRIEEEFQAIRNALIESELILLDFEQQGGELPDRAVEDHVHSIILDQFNNDRVAFMRALAAERLTLSEWRKQMKNQLIVQMMRQREVNAKVLVTSFDLQQAYQRQRDDFALPERLHLRTYVFEADSGPDPRAAAEDLRQQLHADAAGSDAPRPVDEWFDTASLHAALRNAVGDLKAGEVAPPIDLEGDIYLVQLLEREEARHLAFQEVLPRIERDLRRQEAERIHRIWIDSLRSKFYVQLFTHQIFP